MKRDDRITTDVQKVNINNVTEYSDNSIILLGYIGERAAYDVIIKNKKELCTRYSDTFLSEGLDQLEQDTNLTLILDDFVRYLLPIKNNASISCDKDCIKTYDQGGRGQYIRRCEKGIFSTLWELGCELNCGMEIRLEAISIRQITIEMSNHFDFNPYMADSTGCYIVAGGMSKGLYETVMNRGIKASVIGYITSGNDRIVRNGEIRRYLTPEEKA